MTKTNTTVGQYAAYVKQSGEGCDYTIGCGNMLVPLSAETLVDAWEEIAEHMVDGYGYPNDDLGIDHVVIVRVESRMTGSEFDDVVEALEPEDDDEDEGEGEDPAVAERRQQYEQLKKEFG